MLYGDRGFCNWQVNQGIKGFVTLICVVRWTIVSLTVTLVESVRLTVKLLWLLWCQLVWFSLTVHGSFFVDRNINNLPEYSTELSFRTIYGLGLFLSLARQKSSLRSLLWWIMAGLD